MHHDFGSSNGVPITIGAAVTLPPLSGVSEDAVLIAGIAEDSASVTTDGDTSASFLALHHPDGTLVGAPVRGVPGADRLKVEGLVVRKAERAGTGTADRCDSRCIGIVDTDPDDAIVPSLVAGEVVVGPRRP